MAPSCRQSRFRGGICSENGEGGLAVIDIKPYNRRENMLKLREELLAVEEDRISVRCDCTLDELNAYLDDMISEV